MSITPDTLRILRRMRLQLDATVDKTTSEMAKAWARAWEEAADEWEQAVADLVNASKDGRWPTRAQVLRAERVRRAMSHTLDRLRALAKANGVIIFETIPPLVADVDGWVEKLAASQLPDDAVTDWARTDPQALDAIVARTTGQVESLLWKLPAEQQAVMKQVLIRGVMVGDSPRTAARQMVQRLGGAFLGGRARALNIARTEILDAHRAAALASRKANADVLDGWRWVAKLDRRTCPACLGMHGTRHPVDEQGPLGHQSCRCAAAPVTKSWRDLGFDIDEPDDTLPDAQAWFDALPGRVQRDIVGPKRHDLMRAGRLTLADIPVRRRTPGWRDSFVARPVAA